VLSDWDRVSVRPFFVVARRDRVVFHPVLALRARR
jgi:hypothetical protein